MPLAVHATSFESYEQKGRGIGLIKVFITNSIATPSSHYAKMITSICVKREVKHVKYNR